MIRNFILFFFSIFFIQRAQASLVYVPNPFSAATARMVVVIHGCLQSPESMALGTGWNQFADKNNLVILYPRVPEGSNEIDCWSWYLPENQSPQSGQLQLVHSQIMAEKRKLGMSNQAPILLTGISSGGATVSGLLACFPNDFAAAAVHSGPSYGLAQNIKEAQNVLAKGPQAANPEYKAPCKPSDYKGNLLVIQGSQDKVVNPKHASRLISDFLGSTTSNNQTEKTQNGLSYKMEDYVINGKLRGRHINVRGLGHAWAGYGENFKHNELVGPGSSNPTKLPFFEIKGPSSTHLIWEFFSGR